LFYDVAKNFAEDVRSVVLVSGTNILADPIGCAVERAEADDQAGNLLADLERRQDDVLAQLDELDRRVSDLLRGLGVTLIEDSAAIEFAEDHDEESDSDVSVVAMQPPSATTLPVSSKATNPVQDEVSEATVGFSKLPTGAGKSRVGKRSKSAFNDSTTWDQNSRAA
jgi:hypothetical protein